MRIFTKENTIGFTEEEIEEMNHECGAAAMGFKRNTKEFWQAVRKYVESRGDEHVQAEDTGAVIEH